MSNRQKLKDLINKIEGIVLTKELKENDIPRQYLSIFVEENKLQKLKRGIYLTPDTFNDEMYILQQKNTRIIYSHETALYLHDLIDRDPLSYNVTVPYGYNASHLREEGIEVHTVKKDNYLLGIGKNETIYGRKIEVYNKERTICDILKNRNNMDVSLLNNSVKNYLSSKDKNIPKLLDYADKLRIVSVVRRYAEMFL
jgi:predicted transcriptional regulator of viral defense system